MSCNAGCNPDSCSWMLDTSGLPGSTVGIELHRYLSGDTDGEVRTSLVKLFDEGVDFTLGTPFDIASFVTIIPRINGLLRFYLVGQTQDAEDDPINIPTDITIATSSKGRIIQSALADATLTPGVVGTGYETRAQCVNSISVISQLPGASSWLLNRTQIPWISTAIEMHAYVSGDIAGSVNTTLVKEFILGVDIVDDVTDITSYVASVAAVDGVYRIYFITQISSGTSGDINYNTDLDTETAASTSSGTSIMLDALIQPDRLGGYVSTVTTDIEITVTPHPYGAVTT